MSFGFSVGDFIAVLQLSNQVRKSFVGAPDQFKEASNEWVLNRMPEENCLLGTD